MKKIYLVRHGQTNGNKSYAFQGHINNPLNETGKNQAEKLSNFFTDKKFDAIYASDLIRTIETATPLANKLNLKITPVPELKEISFGDWEGLTFDEITKRWPAEVNAFFNQPGDVKIKSGESFLEVQSRAWQAFEKIILTEQSAENILIVSHGGTIRTILCKILNINLNELWKIGLDNAGVSRVMIKDDSYWVSSINETSFLKLGTI